MIFGKIKFTDWAYYSPNCWVRAGYDGDELFLSSSRVELIKHYVDYHGDASNAYWVPKFMFGVAALQAIYFETNKFEKFKWNEEVLAKKYVDEFLIRMNKLKIFT